MSQPLENMSDVCFRGKFYSNLLPYRVRNDAETLSIEGAPFPRLAVLTLNTIFVLFIAVWIYVSLRYGRPGERMLAVIAGGGIGLLTCSVFTGIMIFTYRRASQKGPLLVYHHASKTVELPRVGRTYPVEEIRLQWLHLTGAQRETDGGSELQLRHEAGEHEPETILLITSSLTIGIWQKSVGVWDRVLRPVREFTPIDVVSIAMAGRHTPSSVEPYPM